MTKLPDELADLTNLCSLNIAHNSFIVLPTVVYKMAKLRSLDASHNAIIGKMISSYPRVCLILGFD